MKNVLLLLMVISFLMFVPQGVKAQAANDTNVRGQKEPCCPQKDLVDFLFRGKNPFRTKKEHRFRAIAVPNLGYDPTTSLQIGVGAALSLQMGDPSETKISAGTISALFSLKHHYYTEFKSNVYFPHNIWLLQSDWRFYIFNLPTYCLGTQNQFLITTPAGYNAVIIDPSLNGTYLVKFNWLKFHNILSHKVTNNLYIGVGYHLDYYFNINDTQLKVSNDTLYNTPHFAYNTLHGFNPLHDLTSGLSFNFLYDSRDNMINPYKGLLFNVNYRYNLTWLGSVQNSSTLWTEFRTYVSLSKRCPRHMLAFWYFGSYKISGELPFFDLMSTSFDQMNSSGRGYDQGRFRGENYAYGEMEYRFPISPHSHILGGVVFANVNTASNNDMKIPLFGYLKPGAGVGIRIMVGKADRTNIAIDIGIGEKSKGFYIQAQEVF